MLIPMQDKKFISYFQYLITTYNFTINNYSLECLVQLATLTTTMVTHKIIVKLVNLHFTLIDHRLDINIRFLLQPMTIHA